MFGSKAFDDAVVALLKNYSPDSKADPRALIGAVARAEVDVRREVNSAVLWRILVTGLLVLLGVDLALFFYIVAAGKPSNDAVVTIFTTVLSGLLGLFVRPPGRSGEGTEEIGVPSALRSSITTGGDDDGKHPKPHGDAPRFE